MAESSSLLKPFAKQLSAMTDKLEEIAEGEKENHCGEKQ
jgi:hypothetical protein